MSKRTKPQNGMRTFLIIWFGQLISILGSGITSFGLSVWIYTQTGQATPFAITLIVWVKWFSSKWIPGSNSFSEE